MICGTVRSDSCNVVRHGTKLVVGWGNWAPFLDSYSNKTVIIDVDEKNKQFLVKYITSTVPFLYSIRALHTLQIKAFF